MTTETDQPLVTITIPTYNSARSLDDALAAIAAQTYRHTEVIVVDSHSSDDTATIAESRAVRVIQAEGRLLKARQVGAYAAQGDFILLLDSDQILDPTAVERAVRIAQEGPFDMLFLEEHSYRPGTWLQRLFELDRRAIHRNAVMDAKTSVMLPRFFRRETLLRAIAAIPIDELADVVAQDHAIIHWEASRISQRTSIVPNAVYHMDPGDVLYVLKHFYRKGQAARKLERNRAYVTRYKEMFAAKSRSRGLGIGRQRSAFESNLVLLLKGVPYLAGKWLG